MISFSQCIDHLCREYKLLRWKDKFEINCGDFECYGAKLESHGKFEVGKSFRKEFLGVYFRKNLEVRRTTWKIIVVLQINIEDCCRNLTSDLLWEAFLTSSPLPLRFAFLLFSSDHCFTLLYY